MARATRRVVLAVPDDVYQRVQRHPDFPTRQKGAHHVPDFYLKIFRQYVESADFQLREVEAELRKSRERVESLERQLAAEKLKSLRPWLRGLPKA